jgi:geranylgeranyl pyrophosphate synthase
MREAGRMFERPELGRLAPRLRESANNSPPQATPHIDPVAVTESIAYDFLAKGGKHSRPFITLAAYDALTGGQATLPNGPDHLATLADSVRRAAMSIETFHKASLVHDDIEDDDQFRYGDSTLHRKYGIATAINIGDYLIGLGYRLISRERKSLGAETASDILDLLADAHLRLSEGQGAELAWRDSLNRNLKPIDALKIYALKTSPAFEAALLTGVRLAMAGDAYIQPLKQFARNLGVAFQILNDLKDWDGDQDNKLVSAGDIVGGRPTLLWSLALEGLPPDSRAELESLATETQQWTPALTCRIRKLYREADVFEKARRLVDKHQERAEAIADEIEPDEFRRLLYYLIDTVLDRGHPAEPPLIFPELPISMVANLAPP